LRICRSTLLAGTSAFADDPWTVLEGSSNAGAMSDDRTMSVDQIRQQQQQMIAGLSFCTTLLSHKLFLHVRNSFITLLLKPGSASFCQASWFKLSRRKQVSLSFAKNVLIKTLILFFGNMCRQ